MLQPSKKKLTKQEQNISDATQMKNMRPVFGRDTPLSATPEPVGMREEMIKSQVRGGAMKLMQEKRQKDSAKKSLERYAEGVIVSNKDEKNNPKDFEYLKNK